MTSVNDSNAAALIRFRNLLRARDIFLSDGGCLRRFTITPAMQILGAAILGIILFWSIFAAVQLMAPAPEERSAQVDQRLRAVQIQMQALQQLAQERYGYTAAEVRKLGLEPSRFHGQGGPFEAVEPLKAANEKFKQLFNTWKKLDQLEKGTVAIPSTMPVQGTNFTSGYGVRSDPFRGRAAMHAGVDLAGPTGTKIHATADGFVGRAKWVNGYGNLVELDHGRGIQTRYGHLSKLLVRPGQRVKRGEVIGLMGSTGRSTGSHLHYEVRVDGKAINPTPFMQGNDYLLALQQRAAADGARVAMGGPAEGAK